LEEIQELKIYIGEKYQSCAALKSPPHITLREPFNWDTQNQSALIDSLRKFALRQKFFTIELSNFSCFDTKVIFIDVVKNQSLDDLQRKLLRYCEEKLKLFRPSNEKHPFRPHLTLAFRDLKNEMFFKAWTEFSKRNFSASFRVDEVILLKHNGKIWEAHSTFHF
jgi:2'-5' RNA ligase